MNTITLSFKITSDPILAKYQMAVNDLTLYI